MSTPIDNFPSLSLQGLSTIVDMGKRGVNDTTQRYSETLRFATLLDESIEASRFSRRGVGEKIGRDGSTVAGWCKGRTIPETDDDIRKVARLLGLDVAVLRTLADFDENVYQARRSDSMSREMKDLVIAKLYEELAENLGAQKGAIAARA